jgi:hypothetical protein
MRKMFAAGAALMVLAACGQQGSGVALPPVQAGAQAPSTQTAPSGPVQQAQITAEQRTQFLARVTQYLDGVTQQMGGGATPAPGFTDESAEMLPGTDHRWQVELVAGTPYRFLGACDDDCSNLDIELIDVTTGGVVASDMLPDDFPIVDFTPQANGRYIVRMLMQTCTVAPCFAGTRVLNTQASGAAGK